MTATHMWNEIKIPNKNGKLIFCRHYFTSISALNILYIQTPLTSVGGLSKKVYEPLSKYGFNIFAVDLTGIGESEGSVHEFTATGVISDLDSCVDYIKENFRGRLCLYGSTGMGGIWAQYYASYSNRLDSFAQFGVAIYKDLSPMGLPLWLAKMGHSMLKIFSKITPGFSINLNPPKYYGKNKVQDDRFYEMALEENPHVFNVNINWLIAFVEIYIAKDSYLRNTPTCPTLVFQTLSDRYFSADYFKRYYDKLTCRKKLCSIDDIHNSYYYRADELCEQVAKWFLDYRNEGEINA